jgi:WD40 repeat protein
MHILEVCDEPILAVGISPDSRFMAASAAGGWLGTCDRLTGTVVWGGETGPECDQFAFDPAGRWVAFAYDRELCFVPLDGTAPVPSGLPGSFAGGLAVSPDRKKLAAVQTRGPIRDPARLVVWDLPTLRPQPGCDFWPPFRRIAFSPNGEFIAGIWPGVRRAWHPIPGEFEVRYANSGGLDYRYRPHPSRSFDTVGFVSFTRDSGTCAFGWAGEFRVIDLSTGTKAGDVRRVEADFRDAAFTGSGRHFATIDGAGVMKLWDVPSWQVVRAYDWQCGPLTCVAFTADGTAGVCGTADGRLVQFDVDE